MKVAICIDYDNLEKIHKTEGILSVATKSLIKLSEITDSPIRNCEIRLYGGWYEGESRSKLSEDLAAKLLDDFPAVIRAQLRNGDVSKIVTTAELAFSLLEEPAHYLFNTYRKKGKPSNIRVTSKDDAGCKSETCLLPLARKLLQKGSCPAAGCSTEDNSLIYRHEQKIVDTMLTCDLMYLGTQDYHHVMLISADDDFLPPLRTLLLRGSKVIRMHPKQSAANQPIIAAGKTLLEMVL